MNITVDPATNRVNGWTFDANGNVTAKPGFSGSYDVENRLQWGSGPGGEEYYGYGADNRRVYQSKLVNAGSGATQELVTFWSVGKRAGRFELVWNGTTGFKFRTLEQNVWFGGKPLKLGSQTNVVADRLGSIRREAKDFFPYGQERTVTAGETEKYATYMHDGRTDLAYADQRYYAPGTGRFMTADPAEDGLNWYAYVGGDPVNGSDLRGLAAGCTDLRADVESRGGSVSSCIDLPIGKTLGELMQWAAAAIADPSISVSQANEEVPELVRSYVWAARALEFGGSNAVNPNSCWAMYGPGPSPYVGLR